LPIDSRDDLVTRLTEVRAAITKARDARAVSSGDGSSVERQSLATLLAEEKDIMRRISRIDVSRTGGRANLAGFGRG